MNQNIGILAKAADGSLGRPGLVEVARTADEQLTTLLEEIENVTREARTLVFARSEADLVIRLKRNSWSVAECFEHLAHSTRSFLPAIADAIATAPRLASMRSLRRGTLARVFVRQLEPPYRLRLRTISLLLPQANYFEAAWIDFIDSQSQLSRTIHSAAGVAIDQVRVNSPVQSQISYNVYGALCILSAHQRRHLWQTKKILQTLDRQKNCFSPVPGVLPPH
jgi:hypothetical protein